jgi:hypothetical protein
MIFGVALAAVTVVAGWLFRTEVGEAWDRVVGTADRTGLVEEWATGLQSIAEELPEREVEARSVVTESRSMLVVFGDGPGRAAFTLLAVAPEGNVSLTLVPQSLLSEVPGFGEFRIDETLAFEGPELAALTVTNAFGIRVDDVLALPPGGLAAALGSPMIIDVPVALFDQGGDGPVRLVAEGRQAIDPEVVETLLAEPGAGDGFEWLQRQAAVWRAILERLIEEPDLADRLAAGKPAGAGEAADMLLAVAAAEERQVATIPVEATGGGDPVFLASGSASGFVLDRFDHLLLREGERPRVEVLNGNGRIGATRVVAGNLVRLGFRVVRSDNADRFDYEVTEVIAQGRDGELDARDALRSLGTGKLLVELRAPSSVVDVTIIIGQDIPAGEG